MSEFGKRLRHYREQCADRQSGKDRLSQARLGELLGQELGLMTSIPFQTISRWENGRPTIQASDRRMQLALIRVLHANGGIRSIEEGDDLLRAGNFLGLRPEEAQSLWPPGSNGQGGSGAGASAVHSDAAAADHPAWTAGRLMAHLRRTWEAWKTRYGSGPPPDWPAVLLGQPGSFRPSPRSALTALLWMTVWFLTWWALFPLMRWPWAEAGAADLAAWGFGAGMMGLPVVIAGLAHPWRDGAWQERPGVRPAVVGLYALQGAWIGYQIGGLGLFAGALVGYHLGLPRVGPVLEQIGAVIPLVLGYAAARRLPHDLWRAFGRLRLADGTVAFVCALLGPAWAVFFLATAPELLKPFWGALILLLAALGAAGLAHWQHQRTGSSVIPVHVWIIIYGIILVAAEYRAAGDFASAIYLAGLLVILAQSAARGRVVLTLPGALGLAAGLGLVGLVLHFDLWLGRALAVALASAWWWGGRRHASLPLAFWVAALAAGICEELARSGQWSAVQAGLVFAGVVAALLAWERRAA